MAYDAYMYFQSPSGGAVQPEGETTDKTYSSNSAFEVYSFSWGASNPVSIGSGKTGAASGRVSISSFNVMKRTDKASPSLFATCCSGGHFGTANVELRKAGEDPKSAGQPYLIFTFYEVFVESIQWSGSAGGDDYPTESVTFGFGAVEVQYMPQTVDGTLDKPTTAQWSLVQNTASTETS